MKHTGSSSGGSTRRRLRELVSGARGDESSAAEGLSCSAESEGTCQLHFTLDREELWLLEATRSLLEQLGTRGAEEQAEALLAESQCALLAALPPGALELDSLEALDTARRGWGAQLERWRAEAEARCEPRVCAAQAAVPAAREEAVRERELDREPEMAAPGGAAGSSLALQAADGCASLQGRDSSQLDSMVRQVAARLTMRELELSVLLLRLHRADGWRRLGYATEAQYTRERLGLSRSLVLARRALALRLESLPRVADALGRADIGVEAALQIVRIATPQTELAWLERARQRTVKHLREEVTAALAAVRISGEADCPPPQDAELDGFHELERAVLSGKLWGGTGGPASGGSAEPAGSPPCRARRRHHRARAPSLAGAALQSGRVAGSGRTAAFGTECGRVECGRVECGSPDVCSPDVCAG